MLIEATSSTPIAYSALYFGSDNITDVTMRGNEITGAVQPEPLGDPVLGWARRSSTRGSRPAAQKLDRILIEDNILGPAAYGINVNSGVLLENNTSIVSKKNTYNGITINSIIGSQSGPCVTTTDDTFNGSAFILNVCVANTPALAATGVDATLPLGLAGALTLAGLLALVVARRRRTV